MTATSFDFSVLDHFTGTERWHRISRRVLCTDGVAYLAEKASCVWLLTDIAAYVSHDEELAGQPFLSFKLAVASDKSAQLVIGDGNKTIKTIKIPFTDFPAPGVELWCESDGSYRIILLPQEH